MVTEIDEAGDKKLMVVFENKRATERHVSYEYPEKKVKHERQNKKTAGKKILPPQPMANEVDIVCAQLDIIRKGKEKKLVSIAQAVRMANQRENIVTDRFIEDVESMVNSFKSELEKMQELFGSLMKKLPKVQLDVAVTSC